MRATPLLLAGLLLSPVGCDTAAGRGSEAGVAAGGAAWELAGEPLSDSVFAALVTEISEPGGYFDTDNLISNESSYLHAISDLRSAGVEGGAYVGVGPGQNFSYIAHIGPAVSFIIDIRRDNMLQHLWYKALFEASETRLDYLCLLTVRSCGGESEGLDAEAVAARVDRSPPRPGADSVIDRVVEAAGRHGVELSPEDRASVRSIHERFAAAGLDLRFNTHGRAPQPYYPTLRQLILERDRDGERAGYLAEEALYDRVRTLQLENRVVPVVGDLAGDHALAAIGRAAAGMGLSITALYVSNVEYYLVRDASLDRYLETLAGLPLADDAVIIRSYFNRFRRLPETVPGYASTQLVRPVGPLLEAWRAGELAGYMSLVTR